MWFILQQFLQILLYCPSICNKLVLGLNWYPVSIDLRVFALTSAWLDFPTGASKSYTTSTWIVSYTYWFHPNNFRLLNRTILLVCFLPWIQCLTKVIFPWSFHSNIFFIITVFNRTSLKCPSLHLHLFIGFSSFHQWLYSQNKSKVVFSTQGDSAL